MNFSRMTNYFRALWCGVAISSVFAFFVPAVSATTQFAGLWRNGTDGNYVYYGLSAASLLDLANQYHTNGLRLVNIHSYLDGGNRVWAAIWRGGSDSEFYSTDQTWAQFTTLYTQRHNAGLRLIDIDTYVNAGTRYWAGIWRSGNDGEVLYAGLSVDQLSATNNILVGQNLRLADVETYVDGGTRYWAGLWRSGTDTSVFASGLSDGGLQTVNLFQQSHGRELVDLESYPDSFGARKWAGVWRGTNNPTYADLTMDGEKLNAEVGQRFAAGKRMFAISSYDVACAPACMNTVVAPDAYNYGITRTATHCNSAPGTCSPPPAGSFVTYRWPVNVSGAGNTVRLSATDVPDQFLTIPFIDPQVEHRGVWRYSNGDWHHAADYSRDDIATFNVRAAAPGKVIHVGWDVWSGNTVIVSHNINGQTDNYRTIYMHLRNGSSNDCNNAWNLTIPWFATRPDLLEDKTNYVALLNATGCTQNPATRNPNTNHWGLNSDTIRVTVGQSVVRGQWLAHAGQTGPGGNRNKNSVNTHLHIFFAHRDPTDDNWYFFDPYGIYALPDCYPPGITDALDTDCVRYPIAWLNAHPTYPPPVLEYEKVYLLFLGDYLKLSWEDSAARLQSAGRVGGPYNLVTQTNNPYFTPYSNALSFFRLVK
jgi:murein DD-endopeptidase MepM/ murein hydrolase activator NlpD